MYAKRSQILKNIENKLVSFGVIEANKKQNEVITSGLLELLELFMEPKLRPLTEKEVDNHVLVKQVHHSRKEEVRNFVRNLDYEHKREFIPEDT
jgi:hypothetical protein